MKVGNGDNGKLGHGDKQSISIPRRINLKKKIMTVSCGSEHTAALTDSLAAFTWGNGEGGRLGHADEKSCFVPTELACLADQKVRPNKILTLLFILTLL